MNAIYLLILGMEKGETGFAFSGMILFGFILSGFSVFSFEIQAIKMIRMSITFVWVGPVTMRSPRLLKKW